MAKKEIRLIFIRHGQTYFNTLHKEQGWSDSPLTELGVEQAKKAGRRLSGVQIDQIYSSDLKRATDTASYINAELNTPVIVQRKLTGLREVFYGSFEGLTSHDTWSRIASDHGYQSQAEIIQNESIDAVRNYMKESDPQHDAEDAQTFNCRMFGALRQIFQENVGGSTIVVITHGAFLKTLMIKIAPQLDPQRNYPQNAALTTISMKGEDDFTVQSYNQL